MKTSFYNSNGSEASCHLNIGRKRRTLFLQAHGNHDGNFKLLIAESQDHFELSDFDVVEIDLMDVFVAIKKWLESEDGLIATEAGRCRSVAASLKNYARVFEQAAEEHEKHEKGGLNATD